MPDPTKIAFVVYSLNIGGLERVVVDLANSLDPELYLPYIICISEAGDFSEDFIYPDNLFVIGNKGRINFKSVRKLYKLLKEQNIDLVHTHNRAGLLYSFVGSKLCRLPIIHTNHGFGISLEKRKLLNYIDKWMSKRVNRYVCVSEKLRIDVIKKYAVSNDTIDVILNGIKIPDDFDYTSTDDTRGILIGSIGSLEWIKNYRFVLETFSEIAARFPDCNLELIGDGDEYSNLLELRNELSLQEKVLFRGSVQNVKEHLKNFDVFILASFSEGTSISILEALRAKKVCVASAVGGNPNIIQNKVNGFLFKSNDKEDFLEKLSYVINNLDTEEMNHIRERAQETVVEKFSLSAMVEAYSKLYVETRCKSC